MTTRKVAVIGSGAAGTLVACRLLEQASTPVEVLLIGSAASAGRGVAYSTDEPRHLLNVVAGKMSATLDDPDDFVTWLAGRSTNPIRADEFVPRGQFGTYLTDFLDTAEKRSRTARLRRIDGRVIRVVPHGAGITVDLSSGTSLRVDAAVLALGTFSPGSEWAPAVLRGSERFIADPWSPGSLARIPDDEDVLLVGTGLTMADMAVALDRPTRCVHAISRHGLLPRAHATRPLPGVQPPEVTPHCDLPTLRRTVRRHVETCIRTHGDWRPAIDSLRPLTSSVWQRLSHADRERFLAEDGRVWEVLRHRLAPATAAELTRIRKSGRLPVHKGEVAGAEIDRQVRVRLHDGRSLTVGAVVNCTGAEANVRATEDPLVDQLLADGIATPGPLGLGFDTADDGRLRPNHSPLWTLGALRRGNLLETTAFPEIRGQASEVAAAVLDTIGHAPSRRRPRDRYGLPLATTRAGADAYDIALDRILRVRCGATDAMRAAVEADPDFAVGHAALALLGFEWDASVDVAVSLRAAREAVRTRADDRDRSFVAAVVDRVTKPGPVGAAALLRHVEAYPRDALAVSVAVPTIAFGGVTAGEDTWEFVEGLRPAYGDDWWYLGQLAFVRQEQQRWEEAEALATRALAEEPSSGHAVHARTHVFYETGEHAEGLRWLDDWVSVCGPAADNRAHFSWHAALHELVLGDIPAVRKRYATQLAPPIVGGSRAIVDSASLLWRCAVTNSWTGPLPIDPVLDAAPDGWLAQPPTPFAAMHTAIALAAAGHPAGLDHLRRHAEGHDSPVFANLIAPLCRGLADVVAERWSSASTTLGSLLPVLAELGGSAAQREVIEDTLIHILVSDGRNEDAAALLSARLDRRPSPMDRSRLTLLRPEHTGPRLAEHVRVR